MKKTIFSSLLFTLIGCAPPLENKCYSLQMDKWESAVISENDGNKFRYISNQKSDGILDQVYYPDTIDGKTLFESHAWSKCTKN